MVLAVAGSFPKFPSLRSVLGLHQPVSISATRPILNASALYYLTSTYDESQNFKLVELLWATRDFEATDPRDKVFALIALTEDVSIDFIDYRRNLYQNLVDLAVFCLTDSESKLPQSLDLLSYVEGNSELSALPSWVPEWKFNGHAWRPLNSILLLRDCIDDGSKPTSLFYPSDTSRFRSWDVQLSTSSAPRQLVVPHTMPLYVFVRQGLCFQIPPSGVFQGQDSL